MDGGGISASAAEQSALRVLRSQTATRRPRLPEVVELSSNMRQDPAALRLAVRLLNHAVARGKALNMHVGAYLMRADPAAANGPYISVDRRGPMGEAVGLTGPAHGPAPDVAVEVVGPYDRYSAISMRVQDYFDAGAKAVVTLDAARRTMIVHIVGRAPIQLRATDSLADSGLASGLEGTVSDLFADNSGKGAESA